MDYFSFKLYLGNKNKKYGGGHMHLKIFDVSESRSHNMYGKKKIIILIIIIMNLFIQGGTCQ